MQLPSLAAAPQRCARLALRPPVHMPAPPPRQPVSASGRRRARTRPGAAADPAAAAAAAATAAGSQLAHAAATTESLLAWMARSGCQVQGVQLVYDQRDGQLVRELRATKELSRGEVLVRVPLAATVHFVEPRDGEAAGAAPGSSASASASGSGSGSGSRLAALRRLQARVPVVSGSGRGAWMFKLALELLYHAADPASPLQPYLATLPGACPGIPTPQVAMLWPEPDLGACQCAGLAADAASQAFWADAFSRDVLAALPGTPDDPFCGQLVSRERLGWALALAMSRAFSFRALSGWLLAPLIDMADHAPVSNAEVAYTPDGGGHVRMVANAAVRAGEPLRLCYGRHSNRELLLAYGFCLPGNSHDTLEVPLDVDGLLGAIASFVGSAAGPSRRPSDGLRLWQRTALQQLGLLPAAQPGRPQQQQAQAQQQGQQHAAPVMVHIGGEPPVSGPLLAAVRIVLSDDRAAVKARSLEQLGDWRQPLTAQHEALVMKALVGWCTCLYKAWPTSIQQDRAALQQAQGQAQGTPLMALRFRLEQKLLLERAAKALLLRLKELAGGG